MSFFQNIIYFWICYIVSTYNSNSKQLYFNVKEKCQLNITNKYNIIDFRNIVN